MDLGLSLVRWRMSWLFLSIPFAAAAQAQTDQAIALEQDPSGNLVLRWGSNPFPGYSGVPSSWFYQAQSSEDGQTWNPLGDPIEHLESQAAPEFELSINPNQSVKLFRVEKSLQYSARSSLADQAADFGAQFTHFLEYSQSFEDFKAAQEDPNCLSSIDWDVTTARFWIEFNTSPEDHNASLPDDAPDERLYDFRMNQQELALFAQNGVVVSERQSDEMPVDIYYKVWTDDLPVFISCDSVFDAWHRSYKLLLEELEEVYLYPAVRSLLIGDFGPLITENFPGPPIVEEPDLDIDAWLPETVLASLETLWKNQLGDPRLPGNDNMREAMKDVEFYLHTAASFVSGGQIRSQLVEQDAWWEDASKPQTEIEADALLEDWVKAAKTADDLKRGMFGDRGRLDDMSQFEPRGHYPNSGTLRAYFRTLMWLGRVQFRLAGNSVSDSKPYLRELRAAALLSLIMRERGLVDAWQEIEEVLQLLGGERDSMSLTEMLALLDAEGLTTYESLANDKSLESLQTRILSGNHGLQRIPSDPILVGCDAKPGFLPRTFTLFGQRWSPDSWAMSKFVFPQTRDAGDNPVHRRMPSGMDVAYSVFGNDRAASILIDRMENTNGVPHRDGLPFHQNLAAVRGVMDAQSPDFWSAHIYNRWIDAIRGMSTLEAHPAADVFRTQAWKDRTINTQLGSWTQLRHDTLLYTKQSYTPPVLCEYPEGYVDPYPECWDRLAALAEHTKEAFALLPTSEEIQVESRTNSESRTIPATVWVPGTGAISYFFATVRVIDGDASKSKIIAHYENFAAVCRRLGDIARQQASGLPLTVNMTTFIQSTVENVQEDVYVAERLYNGWFPGLYYRNAFFEFENEHPSDVFEPVVVDVHTDAPDLQCVDDPGGVLHQGVGRTHTMFVAVRHPDGSACMFAGPVYSHYEFTEEFPERLNDTEWLKRLENNDAPPFAPWKSSFLVPANE